VARLQEKYDKDVAPRLAKEFGIANPMAVPRITKVVCNIGLGEAPRNAKLLDQAVDELTSITGQKPVIRKARKSIAQFKLRVGMQIGCSVTLRRDRMFEFLDRLINIALPRVRDFRGLSPKGFDGRGNFTMGIRDHLIFPEIDYTKVEAPKGMNVTVVTTAKTDDQARFLLQELGFPFAKS
jgi:large subunit ribosomal protein L5